MPWVSPTGFEDPNSGWTLETLIYDDNVNSYARNNIETVNTFPIILTHAALNCSKVQINCNLPSSDNYQGVVDVDVYYSAGWHGIGTGISYSRDTWFEVEIGSEQSVTKIALTFHPSSASDSRPQVNEVDFWEVVTIVPIAMNAYRRIREQ